MLLLALGMIVFFGVHLIPSFEGFRGKLVKWKGEGVYKLIYSFVAAVGLWIMVLGKGRAPYVTVWDPPHWANHIAHLGVLAAFIVFLGAYLPSNLKRFIRHPFLWGVILWALSHLLVNGDLASILLFGGFVLYSVFDIVSANRRGADRSIRRLSRSRDLFLIAVGGLFYGVMVYLHEFLFGVPAIH